MIQNEAAAKALARARAHISIALDDFNEDFQ